MFIPFIISSVIGLLIFFISWNMLPISGLIACMNYIVFGLCLSLTLTTKTTDFNMTFLMLFTFFIAMIFSYRIKREVM